MGARKAVSRAGNFGSGGERATEVEVAAHVDEVGAASGTARIGYAPIVRVDASRREIELCATSEAVDSHGTIFDYDASKEAFTRWIGNVREMHGRQAVGSRVAVRCDDEARRIYVRIRISRGAQDTWEKVLDGTLRGASIGASGIVWQRQRRTTAGEQRWINVAKRYDLVELSLVDNPSNPDALGISFVRDATPDAALLDILDEPRVDQASEEDCSDEAGELDRLAGGNALSAEWTTCERLHGAAVAVLAGCGCSSCVATRALLTEVSAPVERMAEASDQPIARALAAGLSDNGARLVALDAGVRALAATIETAVGRMAGEVGDLGRRVAALESQPLAGGPVARPMEKPSAFAARGLTVAPTAEEQYRALESLAGRLSDPQVQVAVAAEMIRMRQQNQ